ncbi:hypothetical protein C0993_004309, partial [Termitomyces sp. T159_Od127]
TVEKDVIFTVMRGVHFSPTIEVFYTYPQDTTSRHPSGVSPACHEYYGDHGTPYPASAELTLNSPCTSTKSLLLGSPSYLPDAVHLNPKSSSSSTRFPPTSPKPVGCYQVWSILEIDWHMLNVPKRVDFSPISLLDVHQYGVPCSTASKSIKRLNSGGELSEKDSKDYDSNGLHIAFSSKLKFLDYDISQSPENDNSIAETEALSPYLDKPATLNQSCAVGIRHPALPVIIWIKVSDGYITVLNVFHGLYDFMMTPPPDKLLNIEPVERQVYIRDARDTRIRKSGCMDKSVKWIDWMPRNRRIIRLSKGPECREHTWMMTLEGDSGE